MIAHDTGKRAGERISCRFGNLGECIILGIVAIVRDIAIQKDGVKAVPVLGYVVQGIANVVGAGIFAFIRMRIAQDSHR